MRLVLDTNVVVSGLLWDGPPARLIEIAQAGEVELYTTRILLAELTRILHRAKFAKAIVASGLLLDDLVLGYAELAVLVTPEPIPATVLNDPDDDHVLACALAANADRIVSGDQDLLVLKAFHDIPVMTAADAVRLVLGA
ncbi:MAG: putative toxin-antitoxin system toxin component, PIN family [Sulfuricaulis sp.]